MRVSSAEFIRNFGSFSDTALSEPIIITKNGRDRLVLISVDEYKHLTDLLESASGAEGKASRAESASASRRRKLPKKA
jgi:prevent-host-death family protein